MNIEKHHEDLLREACAAGDIEKVKDLVETGVDINCQHSINGWTALHWAAKRGHYNIVHYLLQHGADHTIKSADGETALATTNNEGVRNLLPGNCEYQHKAPLPIIPSYLANPPLMPKVDRKEAQNYETPCSKDVLSNDAKRWHEEELVLKIRVADYEDEDFIEIEVPWSDLTFEKVLLVCCKELKVTPNQVMKIRKLPNTVVRNDRDISRLQNFTELELVLINSTKKAQNLRKQATDHVQESTSYNAGATDATSPLARKSNYCKNGTILY